MPVVSAAEPLYVVEIDVESKNVVVGKKNELSAIGLVAHSVNWLEPLDQTEIEAEVQIRYRAPAIACSSRLLCCSRETVLLMTVAGRPDRIRTR